MTDHTLTESPLDPAAAGRAPPRGPGAPRG
jgi:hypothetical protein